MASHYSRPQGETVPARVGARGLCGVFIFTLLALSFAPASTALAAAVDEDQVIVPKASATPLTPDAKRTPVSGTLTFVAVLLLGGAGGWMLWRGRSGGIAGLRAGARAPRNLVIEETRSLGNRQYLVVAAYQDKKFLLGVCQGRIDLLSSLDEPAPAVEKPHA